MKKYVCEVCGWVYDEALGDPEPALPPAPNLRIYQPILNARCVALARTNSPRNKQKDPASAGPFCLF